MSDNRSIALSVLEKVGGKENIVRCFHCITRLRFELKDKSVINKEDIEAIPGVISLKIQGDQYQVVIGQNVGAVYAELCKAAGIAEEAAIDENLDAEQSKERLSIKKVGNAIVQAVVNSIIPSIPVLIGCGIFKAISIIILQLNILQSTDSTYLILSAIGDCATYFLPIHVAMNAAKHFKTSVPLACMLSSFLILPAFVNGLADGSISTVFGLPITSATYSSTVLPAILITWILSYVYKFFEKWVPEIISTLFVPVLTILVMIPLAICLLGPAGSILGNYMANVLMWLYNTFGWFGVGIMGALRPLLIFTGMHTALVPIAMTTLMTTGHETFFFITGMSYVFGSAAACFAVGLKTKKANTKSTAFGCASTALVGGITEPSLYGILMKYRRPLIAVMVANFIASSYFGFTHTYAYAMAGTTGIFGLPILIGPTNLNLVNGLVGLALSMIVSFVLTWILGFEEK